MIMCESAWGTKCNKIKKKIFKLVSKSSCEAIIKTSKVPSDL